jgi:phosphate/sulfate permease
MAPAAGANDLANAFGSSVGSRTLKLWVAVAIASVFEFLGAMLLGGNVSRTVAASIARMSAFKEHPDVFMWGELPDEDAFQLLRLVHGVVVCITSVLAALCWWATLPSDSISAASLQRRHALRGGRVLPVAAAGDLL